MKKICSFVLVLIPVTAHLQTDVKMASPTPPELHYVPLNNGCGTEPDSTEEITDIAEIEPSFPGGEDSLQAFLRKNITYPQGAGCWTGTTYVQFVVREDGSVTDITILKSLTPELDNEAIRVISLMPNWIPGSFEGKIVAVRYILPIRFYTE